ncbi:hypothetical protein N9E38_00900 [Yoonia sp.]|nr:hypothetical protein [Yoonia sp.]
MIQTLPVLLALLTILGGALVYSYQRGVDRRDQIQLERRRLYRDFIVVSQTLRLTIWQTSADPKDIWYSDYKAKFGELMITAPDEVMEKISAFDITVRRCFALKASDDTSFFDVEYKKLSNDYLGVVAAMRRDSFTDSKFDPLSLSDRV